jgi:hypothetical protein
MENWRLTTRHCKGNDWIILRKRYWLRPGLLKNLGFSMIYRLYFRSTVDPKVKPLNYCFTVRCWFRKIHQFDSKFEQISECGKSVYTAETVFEVISLRNEPLKKVLDL